MRCHYEGQSKAITNESTGTQNCMHSMLMLASWLDFLGLVGLFRSIFFITIFTPVIFLSVSLPCLDPHPLLVVDFLHIDVICWLTLDWI